MTSNFSTKPNLTKDLEIKKYVAFNPSSSESTEWWTANSIKEMNDIFWSVCIEDKPIRSTSYNT